MLTLTQPDFDPLCSGPVRRSARVLACCLLAFAGASGTALAQEAPLGSDLQGLLAYARAQSPELNAMRQEADAAAQRVGPAGALPDPVLRIELMDINNYASDASPSLLPSKVGETKYTLMQSLPLWGKRELKRDAAAAEARQADARSDAAWSELAARIKATYAEYYRAAGNERLTREVLDLMSRLEQISQARYAGGLRRSRTRSAPSWNRRAMRAELIIAGRREAPDPRQAEQPAGARRRCPAGRCRSRCAPCRRWHAGRGGTGRTGAPAQPAAAGRTGAHRGPRRRTASWRWPTAIPTCWSACRRRRWERASPPGD